MTRKDRILRLAQLRGDLVAQATLKAEPYAHLMGLRPRRIVAMQPLRVGIEWTEAELREAWGR